MGKLVARSKHRLMCGNSTNPDDVKKLMAGAKFKFLFTSPPYAQQRQYKNPIDDWDELMQGVFSNLFCDEAAQVLVNIGMVHKDSEWIPYWSDWIEWMRAQGWRRFGWYIWDQGSGLPGKWSGRLAPSHEFIFHFNREIVHARKIKPKKKENCNRKRFSESSMRGKDGETSKITSPFASFQINKTPDSVIRIRRQHSVGIESQHPAIFPVEFSKEIQLIYSKADDICYEPFCGSGTQIIAGEEIGRRVFAMEIAAEYVDISVIRWQTATGHTAILESTGELFNEWNFYE